MEMNRERKMRGKRRWRLRQKVEWLESHQQMLHPKEEQHGSPSGHLFSQVCSPNVIKTGAALVLLLPPLLLLLLLLLLLPYISSSGQKCKGTFSWGADGGDEELLKSKRGGTGI